jgi:hypothetical protein
VSDEKKMFQPWKLRCPISAKSSLSICFRAGLGFKVFSKHYFSYAKLRILIIVAMYMMITFGHRFRV